MSLVHIPTQAELMPPYSAEEFNRYDNGSRNPGVQYQGLEGGPIPTRIPRIWFAGLRSWAGPRQWGYLQAFWRLQLTPLPISRPAATTSSISAALDGGRDRQFADTSYVPALFVGWNPGSSVK